MKLWAVPFRAPGSYTGQESVELYCHGSLPGIQKILQLLFRSGFRQASPGEFTFRAFVNGKMDLTRAEAVQEDNQLQIRQGAVHGAEPFVWSRGKQNQSLQEPRYRYGRLLCHSA